MKLSTNLYQYYKSDGIIKMIESTKYHNRDDTKLSARHFRRYKRVKYKAIGSKKGILSKKSLLGIKSKKKE